MIRSRHVPEPPIPLFFLRSQHVETACHQVWTQMSRNSSFLSSPWSSHSTQSPTTSFSSSNFDVPRSRSRRRRSSADENDRSSSKYARTSVHHDVIPYRQSPEPMTLCGPCHSLDLDHFITSRRQITSSLGEFITYLDWITDPSCALCVFFKSMRVPDPHRNARSTCLGRNEAEETGYHLRAFSGMRSYREYFVRPPTNRKSNDSSDIMLAVIPNGLFSNVKNTQQHLYAGTFGSVGYILPVAYSAMSPWLTGRPVDPIRVNFPVIQEWLQHCKKKHSCAMRFSRPLQLSMIDCKTLDIVVAPPNCNYFALSYVWGVASVPVPAPSTTADTPSKTRDLFSTAAPVVRDAIKVVQRLGWRYLWVDKYCIPQVNPALKAEQIQRMDLIYEGAYCTIVAASGSSDRDGLPGVGVPRHAQPSLKLVGRDVHFVSSLPDPQAAIKTSTWNTRAWTFQEAHCSARRLIFTRHQVYFECKATHACEAVELPLSLTTGAHARPVLFRDEWLTGTHRFGALSAFWAAVKAYSLRRMTFDSDALTALDGILRRFQASPSFVYNVFGIPIVLEEGPSGDKDALLDPRLFIAGLSWHHGGTARRRQDFPSWTWAGWEGPVQLQRTFGGANYLSNVRLWVRDVDGVTFPWEMFWDGFWKPDGKAKCYARFECLIVDADVFKVQLVKRIYQLGQGASGTPTKTAVFDMVSPYDPTVKYSSVMLPANLVDQSRVTTELWDCMFLGAQSNGRNPDIMLLRWNVDVAERIWAGTLWPEKSHGTRPRAHFPPLLRKKFRLG